MVQCCCCLWAWVWACVFALVASSVFGSAGTGGVAPLFIFFSESGTRTPLKFICHRPTQCYVMARSHISRPSAPPPKYHFISFTVGSSSFQCSNGKQHVLRFQVKCSHRLPLGLSIGEREKSIHLERILLPKMCVAVDYYYGTVYFSLLIYNGI